MPRGVHVEQPRGDVVIAADVQLLAAQNPFVDGSAVHFALVGAGDAARGVRDESVHGVGPVRKVIVRAIASVVENILHDGAANAPESNVASAAHPSLQSADDEVVWQHAAATSSTIVTKADDFRQKSFLRGSPPKVIWVHLGNCRSADVEAILRTRHADILMFAEDDQAALLVLTRPD